MKLLLKNTKPRNPHAMTAMRRRAGSHRSGTGALRQQAARALRHELHHLRSSP